MKTRSVLVVVAILFLANALAAYAQTTDTKFEAGGQFTLLNRSAINVDNIFTESSPTALGFGGRFAYSPSRFWSLEAELNFFPRQDNIGGSKTQGLFGLKAGRRFEKFGVFAKVRPGFIRFEHVADCPQGTISSCNDHGKTKLALDLGGVVEYYPTKRTAIRADFGDTVIWYGHVTLLPFFPEIPTPIQVRRGTKNNFQFSAGFSFRF